MKKNTAGQAIGAQMITAGDGTVFTGTVTAYVTGDAGTQAIGSVGSGVCTHKGNGYHTYAPAQAETNYDLIAFTFIGTGAVASTVQTYTEFDANVLKWLGTAVATPTVAGVPEVDLTHMEGVTQSVTDLKDFADAGYDPATNKVQGVVLVDTTTTNTDMRGTDSAGTAAELAKVPKSDSTVTWNATALGSINAECDTALTDYDGPTNAEMEARTLLAASYFDPAVDTVANVTLVDTTTTNTDMRGTDGANTVVPDAAGTAATPAEVNAEVLDVLTVDTFAEPGQGAPAATTTILGRLQYLYKAWRNQSEQTATTSSLYNDAGSVVDQKATVSDDGTTFTKGEQGTGP